MFTMAFFNTKYPYMRLIDDTSRHNKGTNTIQTSGNLSNDHITGDAVFGEDYVYHSYQIIPLTATTAEFNVEGSNDNVHWTNIPTASGSLKKHLDLTEEARQILKRIVNERRVSGLRQNDLLDMLYEGEAKEYVKNLINEIYYDQL